MLKCYGLEVYPIMRKKLFTGILCAGLLTACVLHPVSAEDLMVADFVKQNQSEKEVDLTFRHTLAKVEFVFKTLAPEANSTAPDVWVQSLSMGNLKNKGTLDVTAKSGETDVVWEYDWTPDQTATAVTFTDDWSESATYLDGSDSDVVADATAMKLTTADNTFATWLMMPQTIGETHMVNINYVINERKFTAVFPLGGDSNTPITEWAVNQHIKYTVILAPNTITFVPTVLDWTTATSVEYQN
jgi:hypothetical protein